MFEPIKTVLILNKKSHDINGNPIFNIDIEVNGTLNIKDYQFRIEESVKELAKIKFGAVEFEVVEDYHK